MTLGSNSALKHVGFADLPNASFVRVTALIGPHGILPIGRATFWHWISIGLFPKPVKLGPRISAWRVGDVRDALLTLVKEG